MSDVWLTKAWAAWSAAWVAEFCRKIHASERHKTKIESIIEMLKSNDYYNEK